MIVVFRRMWLKSEQRTPNTEGRGHNLTPAIYNVCSRTACICMFNVAYDEYMDWRRSQSRWLYNPSPKANAYIFIGCCVVSNSNIIFHRWCSRSCVPSGFPQNVNDCHRWFFNENQWTFRHLKRWLLSPWIFYSCEVDTWHGVGAWVELSLHQSKQLIDKSIPGTYRT